MPITFAPFGLLHLAAVVICLTSVGALVVVGGSLHPQQLVTMQRFLGVFGLVYWLSYNLWWNRNGLDLVTGLPLQLCDINGIVAPATLLTQNRWLRATLYFWAFALTTQAFIQPALQVGPANPIFWWFWAQHTIILGYAVFDLVVLGFRPDSRDLSRACATSALYLAVVVPLNARLGADYGFVGNLPPTQIPPFIAALGPWPWRAIVLVGLSLLAFVIVLLPWLVKWPRKLRLGRG